LLTGVLQIVMGPDVTLVSSAEETAKDTVRVLTEHDLLAESTPDGQPRHELIATGPVDPFTRLARRFLGPDLGAVIPLTRM
jgi:glutamate racemase